MQATNYTGIKRQGRPGEDQGLNIRKLLEVARRYWALFLGCVLATSAVAFLYLRYSTPSYKVKAALLVQDEKKGGNMPDNQMLMDLGFLGGKSNVDNEVEILKSRTLMERVVADMQLNVQYYSLGHIKASEVYNDLPFRFVLSGMREDALNGKQVYTLKLMKGDRFEMTSQKKKWIGRLNESMELPIGHLELCSTSSVPVQQESEYTIHVTKREDVVNKYMQALNVAVPNKQVSIINLTLDDEQPHKGEEVLNKLIEVYLRANEEDKNRIADSTMGFIDERLALVGTELSGIEHQIEDFKKTNEVTDLSEQSRMLLSNTSDYLKQLTQQEVQLSVVSSLDQYLNQSGNSRKIVPASLAIQDANFGALIGKYNALQLERERMLMSNTETNPAVVSVDQQLDNLRSDIRGSITSVKRELQVGISGLRQRTGGLDAQIRQVPAKERVYLEYSRQQNIKQELYLFLLKKREETAITKSSTIANARVVDPAKCDRSPFKPKRSLILLSAMLLGLILPGGGIYLKSLLNNRLQTKADIQEGTDMPILAEIGNNDSSQSVVVHKGSRTQLSEQFRSLRTNVQFLLRGGKDKVVLLTSSMSGEGKSFVSMNLACAIALTGKKVLFVAMDLRKSNVYQGIHLNYQTGFSNYAIGQASLDDIVQPSGILDNLYIVPSGPIPPNPSELLLSEEVNVFFGTMKEAFDYIIVDTAPLGLVTDAQLLSEHANVTLYLVRQGYTYKHQLQDIEALYQHARMPKLHLIVNDVPAGNDYYGYGYGGSYGYYNSYYGGNEGGKGRKGKGLFSRLIK